MLGLDLVVRNHELTINLSFNDLDHNLHGNDVLVFDLVLELLGLDLMIRDLELTIIISFFDLDHNLHDLLVFDLDFELLGLGLVVCDLELTINLSFFDLDNNLHGLLVFDLDFELLGLDLAVHLQLFCHFSWQHLTEQRVGTPLLDVQFHRFDFDLLRVFSHLAEHVSQSSGVPETERQTGQRDYYQHDTVDGHVSSFQRYVIIQTLQTIKSDTFAIYMI